MRIGMILENPFPPDIRVEKEMLALKKGGHELFLLCRNKGNQLSEELWTLANIVRLPEEIHKSFVPRSIDIGFQWLTGKNKEWQKAIEKYIIDKRIEAVHVHDLPLALSTIAAAKKNGIPAVVDLHEIYPEMVKFTLLSAKDEPLGIKKRMMFFLLSPRWWEKIEKKVVREADHVVVVIEESKQRLIKMGIIEKKISVVLNATDIDSFLQTALKVKQIEKKGFTLCYVGGVDNPNRGLYNLIKAWKLVLEKIPGAMLWIVGDGEIRPVLEDAVCSLKLEGSIKFEGQVPFDQVSAYIKSADATIIPHVVNEHTNNTIPHKLFQYIALGKIVVASDITPIRRILEDTGAGVIASEWSPEGFAEAIWKVHEILKSGKHDPEKQLRVLRSKYGFQTMVDGLRDLYEGLSSKDEFKEKKHSYVETEGNR